MKTTQDIRPGVVAFALGFGHWANGSQDITINGKTIKGDKRRMIGFHANAAMRQDPKVTATALFDPWVGVPFSTTAR